MRKYYIYRFLDIYRRIIYIGRTSSLDKRINHHFTNGHLPFECYDEAEFIEVAELNYEADMYIYEIYLINKYKPKYNTEFNNMKCSIVLDDLEFKPYNRIIKANKSIKRETFNEMLNDIETFYNFKTIHQIRNGEFKKRIKVYRGSEKIQLTNRDMKIIEFILENENVDTETIHQIFFADTCLRTCQARLKLLVDFGLISKNRETMFDKNKYFISIINGEKYKKILCKIEGVENETGQKTKP